MRRRRLAQEALRVLLYAGCGAVSWLTAQAAVNQRCSRDARSFSSAAGFAGLVRCNSKPAPLDRRLSSSWPSPGQGNQYHAFAPRLLADPRAYLVGHLASAHADLGLAILLSARRSGRCCRRSSATSKGPPARREHQLCRQVSRL